MGLATLLGPRARGFFSPYRHADQVTRPEWYPELETVFRENAGPGWDFDGCMADHLVAIQQVLPKIAEVDGPPPEPRWGQSWFPGLDAAAAYAMVFLAGPRRIVEVGSGHSTRFLARAARDMGDIAMMEIGRRTVTQYGSRQSPARITCIDPDPRASLEGLDIDWRREVLSPDHLPLFAELESGDIAFFDSSHLLWEGTDVDLILARILPMLKEGVYVHFHDIFLPDPYPADWAWRGYTEQLGLAGYLTSPAWQIVWASHYMRTRRASEVARTLGDVPLAPGARETSLWLRRR